MRAADNECGIVVSRRIGDRQARANDGDPMLTGAIAQALVPRTLLSRPSNG